MKEINEERKVLEYNLMKFDVAQFKFGIDMCWNLENTTQRTQKV
jgi:hypothetical protein